jgi:hypothetical protein
VPDFCGNLFDTYVAGLQEMYRAFNAQTLRAAGGEIAPPSQKFPDELKRNR